MQQHQRYIYIYIYAVIIDFERRIVRHLRFGWDVDQHQAIVDDVVVSVVTNLLLNTKKKKKSSSSSSSNISNVSSDVQREIFDAAEDARGQRPLEASMELCDTLKLERRVGVDPKTLLEMCSETLRWGEEGMDAIPDMPGAMRLLRF